MIELWLHLLIDSQEYDLIVIGGGSGGLACSNEGEKYIKPLEYQLLLYVSTYNTYTLTLPMIPITQDH